MADLQRAIGQFAKSPVYGWNATAGVWMDSGLRGRLQVFDRFITERDFGQRKRILTLAGSRSLPAQFGLVRIGGAPTAYMVESEVNDVEGDDPYATTFTLHEAPFKVQVCKRTASTSRSGVKLDAGEQILATTWVNISRYSAVGSREFQNTDYSIYTVYFPKGTPLDTDTYVRRLDNSEILDINEVFQALEIPAARCLRRG